MELLFVVLIAAGLGFLAHYILPGRETHGSLLLAAVSATVTTVVWEALLWLGFRFDGGWIWVISLVLGGLAAIILGSVLPGKRRVADRAMLTRLSGGRA